MALRLAEGSIGCNPIAIAMRALRMGCSDSADHPEIEQETCLPPFRAIVVFHCVARLNSIVQAAAQLNVTPSAVSQQVKVLEEQIGAALITRKGRNISLTEAGERYFELISDKIEHAVSGRASKAGFANR